MPRWEEECSQENDDDEEGHGGAVAYTFHDITLSPIQSANGPSVRSIAAPGVGQLTRRKYLGEGVAVEKFHNDCESVGSVYCERVAGVGVRGSNF